MRRHPAKEESDEPGTDGRRGQGGAGREAALQIALVVAFLVLAALAWTPLGGVVAFGG
ncbi:MAG: hypothetical protein M3Q10_19815 [Chloroflexota bacterium]|nr:hypothetical protein [Chloroflexota bacterium]